MAALQKALLLTLVWPKLDPASLSNGGSKGHEAEPNFTARRSEGNCKIISNLGLD